MYKELLEKIERLEKGSRQRKMPFNPENDVSPEERKDVEDWSTTQVSSAKDTMPEINPNAKKRQLAKWASMTQTKAHPETGETMYLLHRGMSGEEFNKLQDSGFNKDYLSGWTPDYDVASSFQDMGTTDADFDEEDDAEEFNEKGYVDDWTGMRYYGEEKLPRKTLSAWIPESQIHHIPQAIGSKRDYDFDELDNPYYEEQSKERKDRFEKTILPKKNKNFDKENKENFITNNIDRIYSDVIENAAQQNGIEINSAEEFENYEANISPEDRDDYRKIAEEYANEDYETWKYTQFDDEYQEPDSPVAPSAYKDQKEVMVKPHQLMIESDEERDARLGPKTAIQKINEKINTKGGLTDKLGVPKLAASEKQISDLVKNIISDFKNELNKDYYTEEQAVDMLKSFILKKYEENPEILEKSDIRTAFKNGLTFLALVNAAYYAGQDKTDQKPLPEPQAIERVKPSEDFYGKGYREEPVPIDRGLAPEETPMIEDTMAEEPSDEIGREPSSEDMEPTVEDDGEAHDQKINEFLQAISLNESSGGKNLKHKTMKSGMHRGDTAIGQYGLMPNTVQEMAGRIRRDLGSDHPLVAYKKMDEKQMRESFKQNPEHEEDMARFMADHIHKKYGGNENKMAWSWLNGHNTTNFPKDYENHYYVQRYNKHIEQVRKPKKQE